MRVLAGQHQVVLRGQLTLWGLVWGLVAALLLLVCGSHMPARSSHLTSPEQLRFELPCGLCDANGHDLLPQKYAAIMDVGNGILLTVGIDPLDDHAWGQDRSLVDTTGKPITLTLPAGYSLYGVASLGKIADKDHNVRLSTLPDDSILEIIGKDGRRFCSPKGQFVDDAIVNQLSNPSARRQCVSDSRITLGAGTALGRVSFGRLPFGLRVKRVTPDNGSFDRAYWLAGHYSMPTRIDMFNRFLKEYDIIGMSEEQVFELLGSPCERKYAGYNGDYQSLSYLLCYARSPSDGSPALSAVLDIADGKVIDMYLKGVYASSIKYTTNVVLDPALSGYIDWHDIPPMVPK